MVKTNGRFADIPDFYQKAEPVSSPVAEKGRSPGYSFPFQIDAIFCYVSFATMKADRTRQLPLFPTHVIGSLPRPRVVRDLLKSREIDGMPEAEFKAAMDDMVRFAIRLQEQAGLDVVSDGEWRRSHYIGEFLKRIGGFEPVRKFTHQGEEKFTDVVVRRIEATEPVFAEDATFLAANTDRVTKFGLPSPFLIAIRYWHEDYSRSAYPTIKDFLDDLTARIRVEAIALEKAGIDIIQLDDPALTYFCDAQVMKGETHDERLRQNWDIDTQLPMAVGSINTITEGLKAEIHLHCCHSVYKRMSDVTGDYKPLLPRLADANIDRVNLEFAYQGTGNASDLKVLPENIDVGMGVVDIRTETPQSVEEMMSIAVAGTKLIAPERIALNPDCGFAPDAGEPPSIDEAFLKLKRLCKVAQMLRAEYS